LPFPDIDPVLVQLGPIAIRWYALGYVAGILLGWGYALGLIRNARLWERLGPPATKDQFDDLIVWLTLGIILGGRLGHVLFYTPQLIWTDPLEILKVWHGGMSFHGGALGVLIATVAFARVGKLDLFRLGDLVAASAPFGIFLVRVANFVNAELWGRPTDAPWGVVFCNERISNANGGFGPAGEMARHPSQLYEAALEGW
jgi:phosphatidylglycerol---prolipoprotein diacylglyceryl transferase